MTAAQPWVTNDSARSISAPAGSVLRRYGVQGVLETARQVRNVAVRRSVDRRTRCPSARVAAVQLAKAARNPFVGVPSPVTLSQPALVCWVGDPE
jgi:hypothetical protein